MKGGDVKCYVFDRFVKMDAYHEKEKKDTKTSILSRDSRRVDRLIRTAQFVRARGEVRPLSDDPVMEERVGILISRIRSRKKISIEEMANSTGCSEEELIALEGGFLPRTRMNQMLPVVLSVMGVDMKKLLNQNSSS
jgi:hypothetical protein